MSTNSDKVEHAASICPLCGGRNDCRMAAGAQDVSGCWCGQATIPQHVLDRIPEAQRGLACVCAKCAAQDETQWPDIHQIVTSRLSRIRRDR
jgi:hypothetical protein